MLYTFSKLNVCNFFSQGCNVLEQFIEVGTQRLVVSFQTQLRPVHRKSADILKRNCFVSRSSCSADSSRDFKFKYSLHNAMK